MNMNTESYMWGEKRREPEPVESWNVYGGKSKSLRRGIRGKKGGGGKVRSLITGGQGLSKVESAIICWGRKGGEEPAAVKRLGKALQGINIESWEEVTRRLSSGKALTRLVAYGGCLLRVLSPSTTNWVASTTEFYCLTVLETTTKVRNKGVSRAGSFWGPSSLCLFSLSPICAWLCAQIFPINKDTSHLSLGLTLVTLFHLGWLDKDLVSK